MTLARAFAVFALAMVASAGWGQDIALAEMRLDATTGLKIHYPAGWTVDPQAVSFMIVSFKLARRPPQLLVPMNEAQIVVAAAPPGVGSIEEWLRKERINVENHYQITRVSLFTKSYGTLPATLCQREIDVIPRARIVAYFFQIDKQLLKATLLYRGEARAEYFKALFLSIIGRLEPAP